MTLLFILIAVLLFGVLIAIHEFGHFASAKLCGVRVEEFSIGMGPAVFKKQRGETLYSLRILPIGGYCAMTGEDEESDDPGAFGNQEWWKRLIILVSGALMNFLLGFLLVLLLYSRAGAFRSTVIEGFIDGCPYEGEDGLLPGDRLISIDGYRILEYADLSDALARGGESKDIKLVRDGKRMTVEDFHFVPIEYSGYETKMYGLLFGYEEATPGVILRNSWNSTMEFCRWVWLGLEELFSGRADMQDMSGPVGVVDLMAESATQAGTVIGGIENILYISAFIAVNLAVMNMLPVPALDGGRVFCLIVTRIIETLTGKRLDPKYEAYIHTAGMMLLLAFMAVIMFNDIARIVRE